MTGKVLQLIMPQSLHSGRLPMHLIPILIVAYSCLLPREFMLLIEDAALFPYRFALIICLPFAIARLARYPVRPTLIDAFAAFASVWFVISLIMTTSYEAGLISGTSYAIDYGGAYLLGRASIRSPEDLRQMFRWFLPGIFALVAVLAAESFSHRMLLRPNLADLLGRPDPFIYYRIRFGLLRAMGPFPHPILGGVFLASVLPLGWYLAHNSRMRLIGFAAGLGAIFTVSSTAVLGLVTAIGLIAMDFVQRNSRLPIFPLAALALAMMATTVAMVSESGLISFLIRNFTFDAGSGYYRVAIWEYGGAEAVANPLFGIGMRDWARPEGMVSDSVDAYWLLEAMIHGFPLVVALGLVILGALGAVIQTQKFRHDSDKDAGRAVICFLAVAIISGFSVHLWESINSWIVLIIGSGVSLATQARQVPTPEWRAVVQRPAMFHNPPVAAE